MPGKEDDIAIVCGLERAIVGNDRVARRRLLDRLVTLLSTTDTAAGALVSQGGIRVLITAARDRDEKIRLHALKALSRLADAGYAVEIREEGAKSALGHLVDDPHPPVRSVAVAFLEKLEEA